MILEVEVPDPAYKLGAYIILKSSGFSGRIIRREFVCDKAPRYMCEDEYTNHLRGHWVYDVRIAGFQYDFIDVTEAQLTGMTQ